ncbi:MAG: ATPase [Thermoflavifilum sp.]|nr:ATPase [Thermoflavifilum sp.]
MSKRVQYTLEYPVRCSPAILYEFLSTPAGLQEWFADKVDLRDNVFSFSWNGSEEKATIVEQKPEEYIRLRWLHSSPDEYFEFRIQKSEVTNETVLIVKDFADKKEISDQSQLWDYQVKELLHRIGGL